MFTQKEPRHSRESRGRMLLEKPTVAQTSQSTSAKFVQIARCDELKNVACREMQLWNRGYRRGKRTHEKTEAIHCHRSPFDTHECGALLAARSDPTLKPALFFSRDHNSCSRMIMDLLIDCIARLDRPVFFDVRVGLDVELPSFQDFLRLHVGNHDDEAFQLLSSQPI